MGSNELSQELYLSAAHRNTQLMKNRQHSEMVQLDMSMTDAIATFNTETALDGEEELQDLTSMGAIAGCMEVIKKSR